MLVAATMEIRREAAWIMKITTTAMILNVVTLAIDSGVEVAEEDADILKVGEEVRLLKLFNPFLVSNTKM